MLNNIEFENVKKYNRVNINRFPNLGKLFSQQTIKLYSNIIDIYNKSGKQFILSH